jgi:hypothetical protein
MFSARIGKKTDKNRIRFSRNSAMMEKHFFGQWHCSESRVYVFVSQQLVHAIFIWHQIFIGAESRAYGNYISVQISKSSFLSLGAD